MIRFLKKHLPVKFKRSFYLFLLRIKIKIFYIRAVIKNGKLENELLKKGKGNELYIVCPYGIGDILVGVLLADKINKNKNKLIFLFRDNYSSVNKILENSGEFIFDSKLSKEVEHDIILKQKFHGKNYIYGHFPKREDGSILFGLNVNEYVWQDYCVYVYGVKKDSLFHIVDTSEFEKNLIKNQKIIICPYAYSTGTLPLEFWEKLTMILMEKNYVIYTNVSQTEKEVVGTKRLECSLSEVIDEANESKLVIAMRSGICDLLAIKSLVPLFVINENEGLAKYWNLEYLRDKGIFNFIVAEILLDNILSKLEEV